MTNFWKGVLITLLVLAYCIFPDLLPGPIDDLIVTLIGIVTAAGKEKVLEYLGFSRQPDPSQVPIPLQPARKTYTARKNFGPKAMCYPMPVFIIATYNADGTPNAMNAAWGGISEETEITICVDSVHKTAENLMARKAFTVSMATADYLAACDYVGIVSGNKVPDKFTKAGFHPLASEYVDAPLIAELPMALECQVLSYDEESCRLVGRIVNVCADEAVLDEKGKVDVRKLRPLIYDPMSHRYLLPGEAAGQAFHDGMALK